MKKQIERCLPSDPVDEANTTANRDSIAAMMAGHTAALITLIDLFIEKRLASKAEVLTHFMDMFAAHSVSKSAPASAAAIRHIVQVLRMR